MTALIKIEKIEVRSSPAVSFYLDSISTAERTQLNSEIDQIVTAVGGKVTLENVIDADDVTSHRFMFISAPDVAAIETVLSGFDTSFVAHRDARDVYNTANSITFSRNVTTLVAADYPQYC